MTAEELMIGDWVQIVPDAPVMSNEYHRIDWIKTGEIGLDNRKIVTYPYIQPIPLTQEILEKNGFKNMGFFGKCEIGLWTLLCDAKTICIIHGDHTNIDTPIEYVHKLQHALRLCRIKDIEL